MGNTAKGYIAKRDVVIKLIKGNYVDDFKFTYKYKSTGLAVDFTALGATAYKLRIYDKPRPKDGLDDRVLLVTITSELSQSGGIVTWDGDFPSEIVNFGKHGFELAFTDAEATTDGKVLSEGIILVE